MCTFVCTGKMVRDLRGAIDVAEAFYHTVRVASLAPIDYNSVKCKSKLPGLYQLLRSVL